MIFCYDSRFTSLLFINDLNNILVISTILLCRLAFSNVPLADRVSTRLSAQLNVDGECADHIIPLYNLRPADANLILFDEYYCGKI